MAFYSAVYPAVYVKDLRLVLKKLLAAFWKVLKVLLRISVMMGRTVFIASDHGGFELKGEIVKFLARERYDVRDLGPVVLDPGDDYPDYVIKLCESVLRERGVGIMICKSGGGASVAANKFKGIYGVLAWNEETAMRAKKDEDANVLCLGALFINPEMANRMVKAWLEQPFEGGRHVRRLNKIKEIENGMVNMK